MRLMIDIDGVLCELRKEGQTYGQVRPNPGAVEKVRQLKGAGHYIILHTARHMKTCNGDVELVKAKVGDITVNWLKEHGVPYDELHFGKPYADVYIDDLSHEFRGWDNLQLEHFDSDLVNIVIPMAGAGSRFAKGGFEVPKPLIAAKGKTMAEWAVKSFNFLDRVKKYRLIFVVLHEHVQKYRIDQKLKDLFGSKTEIVVLPHLLNGQAKSVLFAKHLINNFNKLFIYNCDTFSLAPVWDVIEKENPDGIITYFESTEPRYSYAKNDDWGYVCQTAEKQVISNQASTGLYYFKRGRDFVSSAESMIAKGEHYNNEFYVIPCYNQLIAQGQKIRTVKVSDYWVLGTPEELLHFEKNIKETSFVS